MNRREFILSGGLLAPLVLKAGNAFSERKESKMTAQMNQRVAAIIEAYSAQGIHRTGTATDWKSGEWHTGAGVPVWRSA